MTGGGLEACAVAVAELLAELESNADELTVAVSLMTAPSATEQFTLATRVMVAEAPGASEVNVTVRLAPEPPHTPPLVAAHETKVVEAGRLSLTFTLVAVSGPLLTTLMI